MSDARLWFLDVVVVSGSPVFGLGLILGWLDGVRLDRLVLLSSSGDCCSCSAGDSRAAFVTGGPMPETIGRVGFAAIEVAAVLPLCRDCRWWEPANPRDTANLGCCVLTQTGAGAPENPRPDSKALAVIGGCNDHLWPYLRTAPDFGCVQFEPWAPS